MVNSFTIGGEPAACPPSVTTVADRASETSYVSAAIGGPSRACRCGMLSFQAGRQAFVNASTPIRDSRYSSVDGNASPSLGIRLFNTYPPLVASACPVNTVPILASILSTQGYGHLGCATCSHFRLRSLKCGWQLTRKSLQSQVQPPCICTSEKKVSAKVAAHPRPTLIRTAVQLRLSLSHLFHIFLGWTQTHLAVLLVPDLRVFLWNIVILISDRHHLLIAPPTSIDLHLPPWFKLLKQAP